MRTSWLVYNYIERFELWTHGVPWLIMIKLDISINQFTEKRFQQKINIIFQVKHSTLWHINLNHSSISSENHLSWEAHKFIRNQLNLLLKTNICQSMMIDGRWTDTKIENNSNVDRPSSIGRALESMIQIRFDIERWINQANKRLQKIAYQIANTEHQNRHPERHTQ